MKKQGSIIVEEGQRRWLAILLLSVLIFGSVVVVGLAAIMYANNTEREQSGLLRDVREKLDQAADERSRISVISVRAQTLILKSAQEQTRLQVCVLKPKMHAFCRGVVQDARKVVKSIDRIQRDIHRFIIETRPPAVPNGGGGSSGGTVTVTTTPTQPPTRGESDQCPPNNPHC